MQASVVNQAFSGYAESVARCMAAAGADRLLGTARPVMLKPNLVNASPHPVTTPPALCAAVIAFVRKHTDASIVIAEGCGDAHLETGEVFARLGYDLLAHRLKVGLLDLNHADLRRLENRECRIFPEM